MLVSISEGFCLEGLLGAILFSELDMLAAGVELGVCRLVVEESSRRSILRVVSGAGPCVVVSEALVVRSCSSSEHEGTNAKTSNSDTKNISTSFFMSLVEINHRASNLILTYIHLRIS
jgi:hypothetical protein